MSDDKPTTRSEDNQNHDLACECPEEMRSACWSEFYKECDGKRYCVLHYPGKEKRRDFQLALSEKVKNNDFDFCGVWFPDALSLEHVFDEPVYFSGAEFSEYADFSHAEFSESVSFFMAKFHGEVTFSHTNFNLANFEGAHFDEMAIFDDSEFKGAAYLKAAKFDKAVAFYRARFSASATFDKAQFNSHVKFNGAVFNEAASFQDTQFAPKNAPTLYYQTQDVNELHDMRSISFTSARFKDSVVFAGNTFPDLGLTFAEAIFEKPERVMFSSVTLNPYSFFRVDLRRVNFFDVNWPILSKRRWRENLFRLAWEREALVITTGLNVKHQPMEGWLPYLGITFRQLAVNAEDNNRYEEAAGFRYLAMHVKHKGRDTAVPLFPPMTRLRNLTWWYWLLSGYGERAGRAFAWLLLIWVFFAFTYYRMVATSIPHERASPGPGIRLTLPEAFIYSVSVSALQKPEPLPANKRAKAFVLLETLLGPLQAAFLVLAVRRKFMR